MARLKLEAKAWFCPPPQLTPCERHAIRYLATHLKTGDTLLEIGCGTGRFLRSLKGKGLRAVGMDVAPGLVKELCKCGFEAFAGTAPEFPWNGGAVKAIAMFEVLEHFPEPLEIMRRLRERFPEAVFLASVPSARRWNLMRGGRRNSFDYPPHHFIRWSDEGLRRFFLRLGYGNTWVVGPPPPGSEFLPGGAQLLARLKKNKGSTPSAQTESPTVSSGQDAPSAAAAGFMARAKATAKVWGLYGYHCFADLAGSRAAHQAQRQGGTGSSVLVIAEPS